MPPPDDDYRYYEDNPMQRAVGLTPYVPSGPMVPTSSQISSALSASFRAPAPGGGMFPNSFQSPISTFTSGPQYMQGAGGVLMPINAATNANPAGGYGGVFPGPAVPFPGQSIYSPSVAQQGVYRGKQGLPNPFSTIPNPTFDNAYSYGAAQDFGGSEVAAAGTASRAGIGARMGVNAVAGALGAAAAGYMGGGMRGAAAGFIGGFAGSEALGAGRAGQNFYMRNFGMRDLNEVGYASGINEISRGFVSGGANMDASGQGFSFSASRRAARGLESMALSGDFRRETNNRFNTSDVMRITQEAGNNDLLQGTQSPEQLQQRVKQVAKSLSSFMALSNDPDVRHAIQTMGSMQTQGLNVIEIENATRSGRAFARMAGTTFQNMAATGGATGAQTYQSMGLSQGLGFQSGMQNAALAQNTQNLGISSPALMNMVGGARGLANMNTMFSAGHLQMPMMAPAMMTHTGGLNVDSMRSLMSGGGNPMTMAGMGANNLGGMTRRMGVEGLGMALSMQPLLQDTIGRSLQAQGPFAQRNMEDRSMMALMRQMNMRGSSGFITSARMLGMDSNQALIRAQEMASPQYHSRQRDQIDVRRREQNADIMQDRANRAPTWLDEVTGSSNTLSRARQGLTSAGRTLSNFSEDMGSAYRRPHQEQFHTGAAARDAEDFYGTNAYRSASRRLEAGAGFSSRRDRSWSENFARDYRSMQSVGVTGLSGAGGAALAPMFPNIERARQRNSNLEAERAGISQGLLNTNLSDRDQTRLTNNLFGGSASARGDVGMDIARAMTSQGVGGGTRAAVNTAVRGGIGFLTGGMVDPGNILQQRSFNPQDVQRAYVNRMVSSGMSREQAEANARQNMPAIIQAVSRDARYFSTDTQRREMERTGALAGHAGEGMQTRADVARATTEGSYRRVFGESLGAADSAQGRHQREGMGSMLDRFEGVGRNAEQRVESRGLMTAAASLRAIATGQTGASEEGKQQAIGKLRQLEDQMRRRGFSTQQIDQIRRQTQDVHLTDDQRQMASRIGNMSVSDMATNLTAAATERTVGEGQRLTAQGASRFAGAGGEMSRIFQVQEGRNRRQATSAEVLTGLQNAGGDDSRLRALSSQNRVMGDLARRAARGEDVTADVERAMRGAGETEDRAGKAYDEREAGRTHLGRGFQIFKETLGLAASREEEVSRAVSQGTGADQDALNQTTSSSMLQSAARAMGIGGGNDQLLQATQELRRAAEALSGAAESGQLQRLTAADAAGV